MKSIRESGLTTLIILSLAASPALASVGPKSQLERVPESTVVALAKTQTTEKKAAVVKTVSDTEIRKRHLAALDVAAKGKEKTALKMLQKLESVSVSQAEKDQISMSIGRLAYQLNQNDVALKAYRKISRDSVSWLESLEERAWVELRMGQPEVALATIKTVVTPIFAEQINTEPYFLMSLAQLRVCAYSAVFKTIENFKKRYRDKVRSWENSSDVASKTRLKEASSTIQKISLVEAEAIQRLYIDENGRRHAGSVPRIVRGSQELTFPETEGDEVWLDEIENWQVRLKGCPVPNAQAPKPDGQTKKRNT